MRTRTVLSLETRGEGPDRGAWTRVGAERDSKERSPHPGRTQTSQKPDMLSTYVILYAAYAGRCMQHTSCNALGRVGPLFSGTGVPLGSGAGKGGPIRPRVEERTRGRSLKNCGAPHGRYPLLLDTRLWYPRAHTLARPPKGGGLVCG
nr:MAG TPA: hypothetical protein [Caudoviricetes sp.]